MTEALKRRFAELNEQAAALELTKQTTFVGQGARDTSVSSDGFLAWCVKVKNLLVTACGSSSEHYKAFGEAENSMSWSGNYTRFQQTRAVFGAAKEDFEGGYVSSIRNLIQAEVFDTELEQAKELTGAGYYQAGAIIAGVVLETNLRQLCTEMQIQPGKLDRMNADLAKAGKYNSLVQKRITALAAIRNSAAHGEVQKFSSADVSSMIDEIERLVGSWLS